MENKQDLAHKSLILAAALRNLSPIVDFLKDNPERDLVIIEDHAYDMQSDPYSTEPARRSAESVKEFFIRNGISADRITARPLAAYNHPASNNPAAGRQQHGRRSISGDEPKT
jgi:outer membrane protein OmpA-like peptidoglycan-associated protein